jgi:hypothetical protein
VGVKSFADMTPEEVRAEADRREVRRRAGVPLSDGNYQWGGVNHDLPVALLDRKCRYCRTPMMATDETCPRCFREPMEDDEQDDVVKLYRAFGCRVYNFSQKRPSKQTDGIPDLVVFCEAASLSWWHETKRTKSGKLSPAQVDFREACELTDTEHVAGGLRAAREQLVRVGRATWTGAPGGDIEPIHRATV